jgi:hypothetical protein
MTLATHRSNIDLKNLVDIGQNFRCIAVNRSHQGVFGGFFFQHIT